tara:strand:- start:1255 stop:1860 length:606 start_codon:yes stop_codon:yes gene_type:complete
MSINVCNNNSLSAITSIPDSISGGVLNLLSTQTASSSATINFTSGLDSTYKEYIIKFIEVHPATDNAEFEFQASKDGGSNYNVTVNTSFFESVHSENDTTTSLAYNTTFDAAQSTSYADLIANCGYDSDQCFNGTFHLFDPSNTTFHKHFHCVTNNSRGVDRTVTTFVGGYFNDTDNIDAISFKFSSGNIDSGTFKLYGVS